jgi:hypothetical protein
VFLAQAARLSDRLFLKAVKLIFLLPFFGYVLVVNGAVPGYMTPTTGPEVWLTGFAQSLANADHISVYAHDIGLPEPAALAFGLPGAIVTAIGLKAGLWGADAYAAACLFWLLLAFAGAYSLCRHFGASVTYSAIGTAIWLTLPMVWVHTGYSMLSIGIALLPAYTYVSIRYVCSDKLLNSYSLLFILTSIISIFMDGYTFIILSFFTAVFMAKEIIISGISFPRLTRYAFVCVSFGASYLLYAFYVGVPDFPQPLSFFRGWGVDIIFSLVPTKGILWFPDIIGISASRVYGEYFGDESVYRTTFVLPLLLAAVFAMALKAGDRRSKMVMLGIGLVSLYLSLGPSFKFDALRPDDVGPLMPERFGLGPTGTGVHWKHVPGLRSMRAVYRWMAPALMAFWAVVMITLADRAMSRRLGYSLLIFLFLFNIPGGDFFNYHGFRKQFVSMEADIETIKNDFKHNERVIFFPSGNDFFVSYLAPKIGIRSFNIGGDKNAAIAKGNWPSDLKPLASKISPQEFALNALTALVAHETDAVGISYADLFMAAFRWPDPLANKSEMQAYVEAVEGTGLVDVDKTDYFAIVRLKPGVTAIPPSVRTNLTTSCVEAGRLPVLAQDVPLPFSKPNGICGSGWASGEGWGRWTNDKKAALHFALPELSGPHKLELDTRGYVAGDLKEQRIGVRVNGKALSDWVYTRSAVRHLQSIEVPQGTRTIDIEFSIPDALSPKQAGQSTDERELGLGVGAVCLAADSAVCLSR